MTCRPYATASPNGAMAAAASLAHLIAVEEKRAGYQLSILIAWQCCVAVHRRMRGRLWVSYGRSTTICCTAVKPSYSCRDRCVTEDDRHVPLSAVSMCSKLRGPVNLLDHLVRAGKQRWRSGRGIQVVRNARRIRPAEPLQRRRAAAQRDLLHIKPRRMTPPTRLVCRR